MELIKIRNKKGTSTRILPSSFRSWKHFWQEKKGQIVTSCLVHGCNEDVDDGGHVIKDGEGGKEYILPICRSHNARSETDVFQAWEHDLVPVR